MLSAGGGSARETIPKVSISFSLPRLYTYV